MSDGKTPVFHTGEFEIALPEISRKNAQLPLILSLGPAFTMIVPITMMAVFGNLIYGKSGSNFIYMTLITGGTSALMGAIWALSNHLYRRKSEREEERKSILAYEEYLKATEEYLEKCRDENRIYLSGKYPAMNDLLQRFTKDSLFGRYFKDEDFLMIRLKAGQLPFQMRVFVSGNKNRVIKSEEMIRAEQLADRFSVIENVPVGVNLKEIRHIGIDRKSGLESVLNVILQLAFFCAPSELRICVIYDRREKQTEKALTSIKFLPHLWVNGGRNSLIAGNREELSVLLPVLNLKLSEKKTHFVFFILNSDELREETFYSRLISDDENENCSVVFYDNPGKMPKIVRFVADSDIEKVSFEKADAFGRTMASFNLFEEEKNLEIPDRVDFLELFKAGRIQDIPIKDFWEENHPNLRLRAPIGKISPDNIIFLDIHESFHGPHGLIAGTTGSGKSELIVTYIVSLCISFSPSEVNFFLIDYKGGGTGKYIDTLPHCAGSISNLSGGSIGRALKAIRAENLRRQELLDKAMVNHVDAYQELFRNNLVSEPMPHLLIVIDEFAELKKEEPEFMKEIISLSAVGRSLGIHLILATQKPAGVVDDKIWSNSHFKLCLKVQDRQDSMDMLHRGEAALLYKPGQCYMQIGNNEYFEQFQTGYLGGLYETPEEYSPVNLVERTGKRVCLQNTTKSADKDILKIEVMVNYVNQTARELNIPCARLLWMKELEDRIEMKKENGRIILGLYDDPSRRKRGVMEYIPERDGNLAVGGGPKSGKTTLLKTIINQITPPDMFLVIDIQGGGITGFKERSNCLGFLEDEEGISVFFHHLKKELKRCREAKGERLFVLIDNVSSLLKTLDEEETEVFNRLVREGISSGIYVVLTGGSAPEIGNKLLTHFKTTMALQMNDALMYGDMMRRYRLDVLPKASGGRCLWKEGEEVFEGQVALIEETADEFKEYRSSRTFPGIPKELNLENMIKDVPDGVIPIGYSLKSGYIRGISKDVNSFLIVESDNAGGHMLLDNLKETVSLSLGIPGEEVLYIEEVVEKAGDEEKQIPEVLKRVRVILIKDLGLWVKRFEKKELSEVRAFLERAVLGEENLMVVGMVDAKKDREIVFNELVRNMVMANSGILLGGEAAMQRFLEFSNLGYSEQNAKLPVGIGYLRNPNTQKTIMVKIPMERKEDEDDYD